MEPNKNPFTNQDEVWFIYYDGIIKDSNQFMMYKVFNDLFDHYTDFLDIEKFKGSSLDTCLTYASLVTERNFMYALRKKEFDYYQAYIDLYDYYAEMYEQCEPLLFNRAIIKTLDKPFCKRIYIYSRFKDIRIESDLLKRFNRHQKITYCYGDIQNILKEIPEKITSFFVAEYDSLYDIALYSKLDYTEIFVADYMYNRYINSETGESVPYVQDTSHIFGDSIVKVKIFTPVLLEKRHYQDLKME